MPNDLSVWTLVLDASPIVQAVVALLLVARSPLGPSSFARAR